MGTERMFISLRVRLSMPVSGLISRLIRCLITSSIISNAVYLGSTSDLQMGYMITLSCMTVKIYNFRGNLTFTLDSGLSITVPNHQLVLPNTVINRDGHQTFANDSRVIPIHNAGRQGASLGQSFLSYVYIHVNNDLKRFSIWQANPTEETDIVSLAAGSCDPDPANDSGSANSDSKLGRGAIAGIVIGVVAGIALVGLAIWFLIWHKRKRTQNQDARLSQAHSQAVMAAESKNRIPELDDTGLPNPASGAAKYDPGVMGGRYVSEMPTSPLPQTQETPVELPADNVRYADGPV
ncbi:hypothetical protein BDDG_03534 [Blastomyces dermatitidis ATCC 18188]|uniref:Uncharacterized protein n=1 Tax=Ajellomyces dermatitidis (strain ATCC 18188 / CBS 674.68) TaxID=653446 RepID=F2TBK6_AJEDA|nr:hypothetical protein BDDG_03534 [Blastomyces dermatitidis ATCC 18188]